MYAHGVEIFYGADDNHVVHVVSHHLQFEFLPPQNRFFQHDGAIQTGVQAREGHMFQIFPVVDYASTCTSEGEGRANNQGETDVLSHLADFFHGAGNPTDRHPQTYLLHGSPEKLTILPLFDHRQRGTNHLHPVALQHSHFTHCHRHVEGCLPSQSGKQRLGSFPLNDFGHAFGSDRFNISALSHLRVGHYGGGVTVDENDLETLFPQSLARLGARIIKFTGLTNNYGS